MASKLPLLALFSFLMLLLSPKSGAIFLPGGLGSVHDVDDKTQNLADQVKGQLMDKLIFPGIVNLGDFKVISYRKQVVAGINYFMKVKIGGQEYIHIRVYEPLSYMNAEPQLHGIQTDVTEKDPIEYFSPNK